MASKKNNGTDPALKSGAKEVKKDAKTDEQVANQEVENAQKKAEGAQEDVQEGAQEETHLETIEGVIYVRTKVSSGRRFRAGLEFTNTFQAITLSDLSEGQYDLIQADKHLIIRN